MDQYDTYVNAEVLLEQNDNKLREVVKGQKREQDVTLCGKSNANPILDTCVYDISFPYISKK